MLLNIELDIVKAIQKISNPFFDWLFYIITQIGDEMVFLGIAVVLYWVFSKKFAFKFAVSFLVSTFINVISKNIIKRSRPYLNGAESIFEETSGYSFPSGHAQATGVITFGLYNEYGKKNNWLKWILLAITILVPFSRIYLGQHYPSDVLVGLLIGWISTFITFKLIDLMKDNEHKIAILFIPLFVIAGIVINFLPNVDAKLKHDISVGVGAFSGFIIGYYIEKEYVKYDIKEIWWIQILKVVFGLAVVLAIKFGIGAIFDLISKDNSFLTLIEYFLIGIWVSLGSMLIFRKVLKKKHESNI